MLLPSAVNRLTLFAYAIDRRLLVHWAGAAALAALAAAALLRRRKTAKPPLPPALRMGAVAAALLLATYGASALLGLHPATSVLGSAIRDGGWLTRLSCLAILAAMAVFVRRRVQTERALVALCLGSAVPVAVGLLQWCGVPILVGEKGFPGGRIWSTFGNAIFFGSYLDAAIPATLWTAWRAATLPGRSRPTRIVAGTLFGAWAALECALLWKTGSRGPILALAAAAAMSTPLALRARGHLSAARALSWAMAAGMLLFLGGVHLVARSETVRDRVNLGMATRFNTVEMRLLCYRAMTDRTLSGTKASALPGDPRPRLRPWLGYGIDCLSPAILNGLPARYELVEGGDHIPDSTHSATMDTLGGAGLAGLLALAAAVAAAILVGAKATHGRASPWIPVALAVAGGVGMTLLWGGHTWALGAATGCVMGVLLLAGAGRRDAPRPRPSAIAWAAIALGVWVEGQFGVYTATAAVLLHAALAGLASEARGFPDDVRQGSDDAPASPFGIWCVAALATSAGAFAVLHALQPQTIGLSSMRSVAQFHDWLGELVRDSLWLHAALPVAVPLLLVLLGRTSIREMLRTALLAMVAAGIVLGAGWRLVERDIRVAQTAKVAEAGRPDVALSLLPADVASGDCPVEYVRAVLPSLLQTAKDSSKPDDLRRRCWQTARAMTDRQVRDIPFDASVWSSRGSVAEAALTAFSDFADSPAEIDRAEEAYRMAVGLVPGSNLARASLGHVLFQWRHDNPDALEKVFDEMLALDPENPVALSQRSYQWMSRAVPLAGEARAKALAEAYRFAVRALRSPSLGIHGVRAADVRKARDVAAAELRRLGVSPPDVPAPAPRQSIVEAPDFGKATERHLGQALAGAAAAMAVCFLLVPPVRSLARRLGWLDAPAARKVHREPTPLLGGLAIVAGVWTVALAVPAVPLHGPFLAVLAIATGLAAVGVIDDRWPLPWQLKIGFQFAAAAALYAAGVRVRLAWLPGVVNLALTLFWLVGVTNAVNFLDNMNGLTSGLTAWSSAAVAAVAVACREWEVAAFALALTGACAGFLRGNNPWRGTIFMGDTGSLFLGFELAGLALLLRFPNNENWVTWLCPVLLLAVPVFDMTHVCVARLRRGRNPFSTPGKDHTSHLFERMGMSRPTAVLTVHGLVVLCAVATWIVSFSRPIVAYSVASAVLSGAVFLLVYFELRFGAGGTDAYRDAG